MICPFKMDQNGIFSGAMLVSQRVCNVDPNLFGLNIDPFEETSKWESSLNMGDILNK